MTSRAKESVWYIPCELGNTCRLPVFNGPLDGSHDWWVEPNPTGDTLFLLWYYREPGTEMRCASYETALRFSMRGPSPRMVLRWVP